MIKKLISTEDPLLHKKIKNAIEWHKFQAGFG